MKKPLLNEDQRYAASTDTFTGACLRLLIARKHLQRELDRTWLVKLMKTFAEKYPKVVIGLQILVTGYIIGSVVLSFIKSEL